MVYWIGFGKTAFGEVFRERAYDSLPKTRAYAARALKNGEYQWAEIFASKDKKYHIESIEINRDFGKSFPVSTKYDAKKKIFVQHPFSISTGQFIKR